VPGKSLPPSTYARYFRTRFSTAKRVTWEHFITRSEHVSVELSAEVLNSDEGIVAVVAHELHEIDGLREALLEQGSLSHTALHHMISPGVKGNLHDQAWDVADALVKKMRATRRHL
jgi:hypothetical protein